MIPHPAGSQKCAERKADDSKQDRSNHNGSILRHPDKSPQDGRKSEAYMKRICLILCLMFCGTLARAQCSPFQGLGAAQFFDNSGVPLTNGVLYSFQAGTSTQQATFTDSTCTVQNVNPITFTTGARVNIWLTTGAFYKFQLCLQNDGSTCAPSDVLFSVDQVPGGATSSGGGGSGPPFISGSANPATTGILRCASGDQCLVFRNAGNSANLALSKDSSDVLTWASGILKFPETVCSLSSTGNDYWCADSTSHHWKFTGNGSGQFFSPGIATAGTSGHVVTLAANGIDLQDGGAAQIFANFEMALGGFLNTAGSGGVCAIAFSSGVTQACYHYSFANTHTVARLIVGTTQAPVGCGTSAVVGIKDLTSSTVLLSATPSALGTVTTTGTATIPAGDVIGVGLLTNSASCGTVPIFNDVEVIYQ